MIKKTLSGLILTLLVALSMGFTPLALAGSVNTPVIPKPDFLPGPDPTTTVEGQATQNFILNVGIPRAINIGISILAIVAFIGILIASINMLTAYGNEDKYNRAKENLRYSIYGLLLVVLSYAIVAIVVAIALPSESSAFIPKAYAVDVTQDVNTLFPSEHDLISGQDPTRGVSLPSGDLFTEVVPAAITNIFYFIGLLTFIAIMVAGVLMIAGRGNEESVTKAKQIMSFSAIAIALAGLGYALIYGVVTLNLNQNDQSTSDNVFVETNTQP